MNWFRPATCFALGVGLGLLGWSLIVPTIPGHGQTIHPTPTVSTKPTVVVASHIKPSHVAESSAAGTPRADTPTTNSRLHLWEALALRGGPDDKLGKWVSPPGLTKAYKLFAADPDAPLNPDFVAFFDLAPAEQARIQTLLHDTLVRQNEMDLARIRPIESGFSGIDQAVEIPGYAEEGAALRQSYEASLRAVLGEARYQVYHDWAGESFQNEFPGLAGMTRQFHFPKPRAGEWLEVVFQTRPAGSEWDGYHTTFPIDNMAALEQKSRLPLSRYFGPDAPSTRAPVSGTEAR